MDAVERITFTKGDEGEFVIHLYHGDNAVRYSIYDPQDVKDVLYLMPKCLSADLEAKNMKMEKGSPVTVEYGAGCEGMAKLSAEQVAAIFWVLSLPDLPSDLDVMVQAIQVCLEGE